MGDFQESQPFSRFVSVASRRGKPKFPTSFVQRGLLPGEGSATGVAFRVDAFQATVFDMRVDLGGGDAGVTKHFLKGPDLSPPGEHVSRKAVAEGMRADLFAGSDALGIAFDQLPEHHTGEGSARAGEKDRAGIFLKSHQRAFVFEIITDGFHRQGIQGDDPFFVSFPQGAAVSFLQMEIPQLHRGDFGDPAACRIED